MRKRNRVADLTPHPPSAIVRESKETRHHEQARAGFGDGGDPSFIKSAGVVAKTNDYPPVRRDPSCLVQDPARQIESQLTFEDILEVSHAVR